MVKGKLVTAKEIVEHCRISYSKVNLYTNLGFFKVVAKKGNKRLYNWEEVERCWEKVKKLIDEEYPLRLVRKKLLNGRR